MRITNNNVNNTAFAASRRSTSNETKDELIFYGEFDSTRESMRLMKNKKGCLDAQKTYYINKDGSGRMLTAWSSKDFPKGTFSGAIKYAKKFIKKSDTKRFTEDNIESLINEIERTIEKNK